MDNATRLEGDVTNAVGALKKRVEGTIVVAGNSTLGHELARRQLVDEYRLVVYPISLGAGKRVFGAGTPTLMELIYQRRTSTGAALVAYRVQPHQ